MLIRKAYAKIVIMPSLILGIVGLGSITGAVQARSLTEIKQTGEVRICITAGDTKPGEETLCSATPPDCRDNCTFKGSCHEEAFAFAAMLGSDVKPKLRRISWSEQFHNEEGKTVREESYTPALLASGDCDVYPNLLTVRGWRLNKFDIIELTPFSYLVVTHKSKAADFRTPADLSGKVAAVFKDSGAQTWLEGQNKTEYAANPVKIEAVATMGQVAEMVDTNKMDFAVLTAFVALEETTHRMKASVATIPVGPLQKTGWGVRKEDQELQAAIQKFFDTQRADPDSVMNRNWKKVLGISLSEFANLMTKEK